MFYGEGSKISQEYFIDGIKVGHWYNLRIRRYLFAVEQRSDKRKDLLLKYRF